VSSLVTHAIEFAKVEHERINHQRKYSGQPYAVHLSAVAKIVATVTDDEEMIAAAWLHDIVEDTPATLNEIEREFGMPVAQLVRELTDVSKPSDGNREKRKAIDREHLNYASARGQTIKLADLIDNCKDITKHDKRFARTYINEMNSLLKVLSKGDERLIRQANNVKAKSLSLIGKADKHNEAHSNKNITNVFHDKTFKLKYNSLFTAKDIAEPLLSFDAETPSDRVSHFFKRNQNEALSIRTDGNVSGYITREHVQTDSLCGTFSRAFAVDQVISGDAEFAEVIYVLTRHDFCFISLLGTIQGVITRNDINKPYMRMWLFGFITLTEMRVTELIQNQFSDNDWVNLIPEARVSIAQKLRDERVRLGQHCELIDCLQLADKGLLLISDDELLSKLGFESKKSAKKILKQFQSLRNNLSHAQNISTYDWAQIARISSRMLESG